MLTWIDERRSDNKWHSRCFVKGVKVTCGTGMKHADSRLEALARYMVAERCHDALPVRCEDSPEPDAAR